MSKQPCKIIRMSYFDIVCSCGWSRKLREGDYGTVSGKDRLLDLWLEHKNEKS